jgi:hypothetical protein
VQETLEVKAAGRLKRKMSKMDAASEEAAEEDAEDTCTVNEIAGSQKVESAKKTAKAPKVKLKAT